MNKTQTLKEKAREMIDKYEIEQTKITDLDDSGKFKDKTDEEIVEIYRDNLRNLISQITKDIVQDIEGAIGEERYNNQDNMNEAPHDKNCASCLSSKGYNELHRTTTSKLKEYK